MKIRVEREALADAVAWVARSLPNRPTAPILAGMLLEAEADGVTLSSFDSTTSAKVTLPAQVTDEADQPPLVLDGPLATRDKFDNELVTASANGKSRTRLPVQPLIQDDNAGDAGKPRHRVQELPARLS